MAMALPIDSTSCSRVMFTEEFMDAKELKLQRLLNRTYEKIEELKTLINKESNILKHEIQDPAVNSVIQRQNRLMNEAIRAYNPPTPTQSRLQRKPENDRNIGNNKKHSVSFKMDSAEDPRGLLFNRRQINSGKQNHLASEENTYLNKGRASPKDLKPHVIESSVPEKMDPSWYGSLDRNIAKKKKKEMAMDRRRRHTKTVGSMAGLDIIKRSELQPDEQYEIGLPRTATPATLRHSTVIHASLSHPPLPAGWGPYADVVDHRHSQALMPPYNNNRPKHPQMLDHGGNWQNVSVNDIPPTQILRNSNTFVSSPYLDGRTPTGNFDRPNLKVLSESVQANKKSPFASPGLNANIHHTSFPIYPYNLETPNFMDGNSKSPHFRKQGNGVKVREEEHQKFWQGPTALELSPRSNPTCKSWQETNLDEFPQFSPVTRTSVNGSSSGSGVSIPCGIEDSFGRLELSPNELNDTQDQNSKSSESNESHSGFTNESTKPFEMADYYKYSTKFRSQMIPGAQMRETDIDNANDSEPTLSKEEWNKRIVNHFKQKSNLYPIRNENVGYNTVETPPSNTLPTAVGKWVDNFKQSLPKSYLKPPTELDPEKRQALIDYFTRQAEKESENNESNSFVGNNENNIVDHNVQHNENDYEEELTFCAKDFDSLMDLDVSNLSMFGESNNSSHGRRQLPTNDFNGNPEEGPTLPPRIPREAKPGKSRFQKDKKASSQSTSVDTNKEQQQQSWVMDSPSYV